MPMKCRRRRACPKNKQIVQLLLLFAFGLCLYASFPSRYRGKRALDIQLDPEEQDVLGLEVINQRKQNITRPSQNPHKIENMERNESLCHIPFVHGVMCPTIYTELGGYCKRDLSTPDGFDCPDIRQTGHNALRSTQLVLTRMLKIFDLVAKKHGIKYWITSGTLLGAARHRGFVPWDEDADVQMPLAEYVKLFNCCRNEFPEGTFFQNSETDPYLRPGSDKENRLLRHPVVGLYRRNWNPRIRDRKSCTRYCLVNEDCDWEDGLMMDIFIAEDTLPGHQLDEVFPLKEMFFEGFYFPVPNNWRDILSSMYGDYNTEIGDRMNRVPEDNADPFHSCDELRQII